MASVQTPLTITSKFAGMKNHRAQVERKSIRAQTARPQVFAQVQLVRCYKFEPDSIGIYEQPWLNLNNKYSLLIS